MRSILFFSIPLLTLGSCAFMTNIPQLKKKDKIEGLEIDQFSEVTKSDQLITLTADAPLLGAIRLTKASTFENMSSPVALEGQYVHGTFGHLTSKLSYPVYMDEVFFGSAKHSSLIKERYAFDINYSFPLLNVIKLEENFSMQLDPEVKDGISYYGHFPSKTNTRLNLNLGFSNSFDRSMPPEYLPYRTMSNQDTLVEMGIYPIEQRTTNFTAGVALQKFINTKMKGRGLDKNFSGQYTSVSTLYLNASFMLKNNISHLVYPDLDDLLELPIDQVLQKNSVGFALGIRSTNIYTKHFGGTCGFEAGLATGYFDSKGEALYVKFNIGIGLGWIIDKSGMKL